MHTQMTVVLSIFLLATMQLARGTESILVATDAGCRCVFSISIENPPVVTDLGPIAQPFSVLGDIAFTQSADTIFTTQYNTLARRVLAEPQIMSQEFPSIDFQGLLRLSPDANWLYATALVDGYLGMRGVLINTASMKLERVLPQETYDTVSFTPDSASIVYSRNLGIDAMNIASGSVTTVAGLAEDLLCFELRFLGTTLYGYAYSINDESRKTQILRFENGNATVLAELPGKPLENNPAGDIWYMYDVETEEVIAWNSVTNTTSTFTARFADHLAPGQLEAIPPEEEIGWSYHFDETLTLGIPRFTDGYVSPYGNCIVFTYRQGPYWPGYIILYWPATATWSPPVRIGEPGDSGGVTNVVFRQVP